MRFARKSKQNPPSRNPRSANVCGYCSENLDSFKAVLMIFVGKLMEGGRGHFMINYYINLTADHTEFLTADYV